MPLWLQFAMTYGAGVMTPVIVFLIFAWLYSGPS